MPSKTEKDRIGKNRRTARLAAGLDKGLLGYATAASAVGVGILALALAQPAVYPPGGHSHYAKWRLHRQWGQNTPKPFAFPTFPTFPPAT
ncbi:MAG: hypothetical protein ABSF59_04995 [Candidatus Sulfotelmatobacter sp.]